VVDPGRQLGRWFTPRIEADESVPRRGDGDRSGRRAALEDSVHHGLSGPHDGLDVGPPFGTDPRRLAHGVTDRRTGFVEALRLHEAGPEVERENDRHPRGLAHSRHWQTVGRPVQRFEVSGRYARHGQQQPVAARNAAPLALPGVRLRQRGHGPVRRVPQAGATAGSLEHEGVPEDPQRGRTRALVSPRGELVQIDFHSSEGSSLGIEMELEIVDVDTRELHSGATEILADAARPYGDGEHPKAKHELLESTIEIITGICTTAAEARADLEATLAELQPHLERRNLAFMC